MEYRKLPHGNEMIGTLGIGLGGIQKSSDSEIEATVRFAVENGVNFIDACCGASNVYKPLGNAVKDIRDKVYMQMHFGAVYNEKGDYAWTRDVNEIMRTVEWELETLGTDYIDFGFLHCVDDYEDAEEMMKNGVLDKLIELKKSGTVHHIGFSSHTPSVANKLLDTGLMDMMMFSINPAYDFERGDEYGIGSVSERFELFRRCEKDGVGISVMKPFFAGKLLKADESPFGKALTKYQCLKYSLDRPGVLVNVPGVRGLEDIKELIGFASASPEELDYSVIGTFDAETVGGTCVYCNHCQPCPAGIDIGLVNKYYDLAKAGDKLAVGHYGKLSVKADSCLQCGHCDSRCPFGVKQGARMTEINEYFK